MFKEINILEPFFEEPNKEFNVRELARILKITPATASKKLKAFKEERMLKHRRERMLDLYRADLESSAYLDIKVYYSISKLRNSGLIAALNEFYIKPTIILFGSVAKGLDTDTSDIDIVIVSENSREFPKQKEFEKKLGKEMQIFAVKRLGELRNKHLINNVLNGMVLQGEAQWT